MKLRELLSKMKEVQTKIGSSQPYICGGTPRDKFMGHLENISDLDITTGDKTVDYLSQEFELALRKEFNVSRKTMSDGHSTIFLGNLKMDFSSNFVVPGIDEHLKVLGVTTPTNMQREMFSRDFTCNALLLELDLKHIVDPTKRGFTDIKAKKIRTCLPPEITLTTNKNRVVRAIYLAAKLGFEVDDAIIQYVRKNPQTVKLSTDKVMVEKLNEAFTRDPDRASYLVKEMGLWKLIPITKIVYPYYVKYNEAGTMAQTKKAYFQGGGGVNEPTPGTKKYKSDPAILVQPRFEEPFYRNYDLYDTEGIDGPAQYGPGSGWNHIMEHKSIKEFLDFRRQRLKGKYVADDFWIEDNEANRKQRVEKMKIRANLLSRVMVKTGSTECQDSDIEYSDGRDAWYCTKCRHLGPNSPGGETPTSKDFHTWKNHNPQGENFSNSHSSKDENDGANYDYGDGAYTAMSEGKKMETITDAPHKSPGAFFADAQYMLPPKEHGTSIYDAKNSPYQGTPKIPKQLKKNQDKAKADDNAIDFDIDNQIKSNPIEGGIGSYPASAQIGGYLDKYLPENDADGKPASELDFGRDLTENEEPGSLDQDDLDRLSNKYLTPKETSIYGLPDGISPPEDLDPNATINDPNGQYGETDSGNTMYQDKWNI